MALELIFLSSVRSVPSRSSASSLNFISLTFWFALYEQWNAAMSLGFTTDAF